MKKKASKVGGKEPMLLGGRQHPEYIILELVLN